MSALKVPAGHGESEYIEKRSSFLGIVEPVSSEEEARAVIAAVKKQHRDARHNCWCYLIQGGAERYSDDGEPQGTAGIPMLEVFRKAGVSNAVCLMVALRSQGNCRWEGPLGTPLGLVHWKRASSPVEAGTAGYL